MFGKITQSEFDILAQSMQDDLLAIFLSMQDDILKIIDKSEDVHDLNRKINDMMKEGVEYARSK